MHRESSAPSTSPLQRAEQFALHAFIFFLPLIEAPKNIFAALYALLWLVNRVRGKNWPRRFGFWDGLIVATLTATYIGASCAGVHDQEWRWTNDVLRYCLIFWMVMHTPFTDRQIKLLLLTLFASTAAGTMWGLWELYSHRAHYFMLHSVGHVNHSAIYVNICFIALLATMQTSWHTWTWPFRLISAATLGLLIAAMVASESRAVVGVALVVTVLAAVLWFRSSRRGAIIAGSLVVAVGATLYFGQFGVVKEQLAQARKGNLLPVREQLWNTSLAAWKAFPICGVGGSNFAHINRETLAHWLAIDATNIRPSEYQFSSHAHNVYLNTLAERGILGMSALLALFASWIAVIIRSIPKHDQPPLAHQLWLASAGAGLVIMAVGLVNTSFHDENALLSLLLLGLWLAYRRRERSTVQHPPVAASTPTETS